jgi:acetyl esterase/lipase
MVRGKESTTMLSRRRLVHAAWLSLAGLLLAAQPATAQDRIELKVWPNGVPGETKDIEPETATTSAPPRAVTRIANVSQPMLTLYPAPKEKANGCAVVVCPGGGYNILAYDLEGTEVAEWLNSIGVTAVLLKYRVPRRDKDHPHVAPLQDAQRAIRLARQNAKAWKIDPTRVGILGFSAGGHLAVMAGTHWDESNYPQVDAADALSCRPDFLIPIYPAYLGHRQDSSRLSPLVRVNAQTPPTFIAIAYNDADRPIFAALLLVAFKKAGVPAELHVYSQGGHGFGLRPSDKPACTWPQRCAEWLRVTGLLKGD